MHFALALIQCRPADKWGETEFVTPRVLPWPLTISILSRNVRFWSRGATLPRQDIQSVRRLCVRVRHDERRHKTKNAKSRCDVQFFVIGCASHASLLQRSWRTKTNKGHAVVALHPVLRVPSCSCERPMFLSLLFR